MTARPGLPVTLPDLGEFWVLWRGLRNEDYPTAGMVPGEIPGPARLSPQETPAVGFDSPLGVGSAREVER